MTRSLVGFPALRPQPLGVDFVVYSNEDYGFIASLVAGTNDNFAFALPYPATLDLFDETIVVHSLEFLKQDNHANKTGTTIQGLQVHMGMIERAFGVSWFGVLTDADDEALKATFAGPFYFGQRGFNVTAVASVEGGYREADSMISATYFPPVPLDLVTPLFIVFTNQTHGITLATNATAEGTYSEFEKTVMRV